MAFHFARKRVCQCAGSAIAARQASIVAFAVPAEEGRPCGSFSYALRQRTLQRRK